MARPKKYKHNYPSVTQIIDIIDKPGLRYWYGKFGIAHCEKIKKSSQGVGQGVHRGIEQYLLGKPFSECSEGLNNDQTVMLSYLVKWVKEKNLKPIAMEEPLYSHKFKFAGTPDVIGTFNGGKTIQVVDWKTDSTPRDKSEDRERAAKYYWQLSGYAIAYEEMHAVKINKGYVVRASKKLEFNVYFFSDLKDGKKEFKQLRTIYARVKGK